MSYNHISSPFIKKSNNVRPGQLDLDELDDFISSENIIEEIRPVKEKNVLIGPIIYKELEESFKENEKLYDYNDIRFSRILKAKTLMKAPKGFFDKYNDNIILLVDIVQNEIMTLGLSDTIAKANSDIKDMKLQNRSYQIVEKILLEKIEDFPYKGIDKRLVMSFVVNEILGMGKLDPLWRDLTIDEITCNGPFDIQVQIRGKWFKVPGCTFDSRTHLENLIERLYNSIGKQLSRNTPRVKGRLQDNSRLYAVHTVVAKDGPNFNIRRHPDKIWTPEEIIKKGSANEEIMTFLGNLIYKGASFLIIGATTTGKTSLLNALTGFYREDVRLITIEDNLEMKPNPKKFFAAAMETIQKRPDGSPDSAVTMRNLLESTLQMAPQGIIVGEVTDGAAYDLCQALNTGHFGASTLHANDADDAIYRLISLVSQEGLIKGDNAMPLIGAAFDFIITLEHFPIDGSRRIVSIDEIAARPILTKDNTLELPTKQLWRFNEKGLENYKIVGDWEQVGELSDFRRKRNHLDLEKDLSWSELKELSKIE